MYFSFKESVSNAHRFCFFFGIFFLFPSFGSFVVSRMGGAEMGGQRNRETRFFCFYGLRCLLALGSRKSDGAAL